MVTHILNLKCNLAFKQCPLKLVIIRIKIYRVNICILSALDIAIKKNSDGSFAILIANGASASIEERKKGEIFFI